jgi:hypothetical protein
MRAQAGLCDDAVLQRLLTFHRSAQGSSNGSCSHGGGHQAVEMHEKLPHERVALADDALDYIVQHLLTPTAQARWTSEQLGIHLDGLTSRHH